MHVTITFNQSCFFSICIEDSKAHNITSKPPVESSKASVDAAFFGAYYDPHDFIKGILEDLDSHVENWNKQIMYANYTSVTQASGMGKSRMVKQLAEAGVYVIYCCLRLSGSGYPPQSHITKYLLDSYDKLHFVAYFIACLNKLADTPGISSIDWYNQQIARENDGASQGNAREFWDDIRLRMEKLKRDLVDSNASASLRQSYERALRTYPNIRNISLSKNILRICFVFDEARCLLEVGPITETSGSETAGKNVAFYNMRRALVHFDDKVNVFTLVMDTVSRLSNFQPTRTADPSARVEIEGKGLFEPLYLCVTTDVMATRINMNRKLEDAVRPSILYRYGRPMWGAQIDNRGQEDMETYLQRLVSLASNKIIGGKIPIAEEIDHISALAILAIRLCLHVSPLAQLSAELVASHMCVCTFISPDRMMMISSYPVEPILAEAAARLTQMIPMRILLRHLLKAIRSGMVEAGYRGELAARIILIRAWAVCARIHRNKTIANQYSSPVYIAEFINALFGIDLVQFVMQQKQEQELEDDRDGLSSGHFFSQSDVESLANAKILFTSFAYITYTPSKEDLLQFLLRGTAIICKRNQKGIDFIIPALLVHGDQYIVDERFISYILFSIKNSKYDNQYAESTTSKLSPIFAEIEKDADHPYLSIYMQLGSDDDSLSLARELGVMTSSQQKLAKNVRKGKVAAETSKKRRVAAGASQRVYRQRHQISLVAIGKSVTIYPCLAELDSNNDKDEVRTREFVNCLHELLFAWPDPVQLHDNDKKRISVKNMLPLLYK